MDLSKYKIKKSKITNQRQLALKDFLDKLNPPRIAQGYPPISAGRLGVMFRFMKTQEIIDFYKECENANNFSKYFWWKMKA